MEALGGLTVCDVVALVGAAGVFLVTTPFTFSFTLSFIVETLAPRLESLDIMQVCSSLEGQYRRDIEHKKSRTTVLI